MMQSSRRLSVLVLDHPEGFSEDFFQEKDTEKLVAIVEKFQKFMKKLSVVDFPFCSQEILSKLMDSMRDVEELNIHKYDAWDDDEEIWRPVFNFNKEFSKLKCLLLYGVHEIAPILDKVPDDFLLRFEVKLPADNRPRHAELVACIQQFLNRQTGLEKVDLPGGKHFHLDHLALENLILHEELPKQLVSYLKNQHDLIHLRCGSVDKHSFNELRKMQNLEVLSADVVDEVMGELPHLKKLGLKGCCAEWLFPDWSV